jgi:hypothetical protein
MSGLYKFRLLFIIIILLIGWVGPKIGVLSNRGRRDLVANNNLTWKTLYLEILHYLRFFCSLVPL